MDKYILSMYPVKQTICKRYERMNLIANTRAGFDYEILETLEAGLA